MKNSIKHSTPGYRRSSGFTEMLITLSLIGSLDQFLFLKMKRMEKKSYRDLIHFSQATELFSLIQMDAKQSKEFVTIVRRGT